MPRSQKSELFDKAEALLESLPGGPTMLAGLLMDKGIRGVPGSQCACPVARYLRGELGVPQVTVDFDTVTIYAEDGGVSFHGTPSVVQAFIGLFDTKPYECLVDPNGFTEEEMFGWV